VLFTSASNSDDHATWTHSVSLFLIALLEFGTRGSEVQILSPRPTIFLLPFRDLQIYPSFTIEPKSRSMSEIADSVT
jgi:hypothetical protein